MTSNNQQIDLDERAVHVLSISGAMCGEWCGDEPGDHNCADCERVRRGYIRDLRAAGWAPQEEHDALVDEVRRLRAQVADQRAYEQRLREQHDLDVAALATARANALTAGADAIDDMERRNAWPVRPVDAGICSEFLRGMAAGSQPAEESRVVADDSDDPEHVDDTLPAWLAQRFDPRSPGWDALSDDDRTYWEHHARAVRRAVARGGFKAPAVVKGGAR